METVQGLSGPCHLVLSLGLFTGFPQRQCEGGGTHCLLTALPLTYTVSLLIRSESWSAAHTQQEGILPGREGQEAGITGATLESGYNYPFHDANFV